MAGRKDAGRIMRVLRGERGSAAVVVLVVVALILVILTVMAFSKVSEQKDTIADLQAKLKATGAVPAAGAEPGEGVPVRKDAEKKVGELSTRLSRAEADRRSLQQKVNQLTQEKDTLAAQLGDQTEALKKLETTNAALRLEAAQAGAPQDELEWMRQELDNKEKALAEMQSKLGKTEGTAENLRNMLKKTKEESQVLATKLVEEIEQREIKIGMLLSKLLELQPAGPLTNEAAKEKYDKMVADAADLTDTGERVTFYFRGAMILTGTNYQAQAKKLFDAEKRQQKAELDKRASDLYQEALKVTRENPDAHDENIRALTGILAKVKGSRMEKNVQNLLNQQQSKSDAAKKAAAEKKASDLYQQALKVTRDNPKAHDENIRALTGILAKVKGSRMEKNVQNLLNQQQSKSDAAKKAAVEKAASDLYQQAVQVTRDNPEAYDANVKALSDILEKVRGSRMEGRVQKLLNQQKAKAEAAAKRAAAAAE